MTGPTHRQRWRDAIRDANDPRLDAITLAVAMALDRNMSPDGRTHTGQHKLARYAKLRTTETVVSRIAVLESTDWLKVDRPERRGGRTYYTALIPPDHPTSSDGQTSRERPTASDAATQREPSRNQRDRPTPPARPSDATGSDRPTPPGQTVRRRRTDPEDPGGIPEIPPARADGSADAPPPGPAGNDASSSRVESDNGATHAAARWKLAPYGQRPTLGAVVRNRNHRPQERPDATP